MNDDIESIPTLLPGDLVRTPSGPARLVRIVEGSDGHPIAVTKHVVRDTHTAGGHSKPRRETRKYHVADVWQIRE